MILDQGPLRGGEPTAREHAVGGGGARPRAAGPAPPYSDSAGAFGMMSQSSRYTRMPGNATDTIETTA